jgi:cell division protein FtsB
MTTENWITLLSIFVSIIGGMSIAIYRVIMRDVKGLIKEQFSILREEKIRELAEDNIRKEAKIARLQEAIKEMN